MNMERWTFERESTGPHDGLELSKGKDQRKLVKFCPGQWMWGHVLEWGTLGDEQDLR